MKTTLVIPDPIFRDLKVRAAERGTTMSELVAEFLFKGLREKPPRPKRLPELPSFKMGPFKIDITKREEIYRLMDEERQARLYSYRKRG